MPDVFDYYYGSLGGTGYRPEDDPLLAWRYAQPATTQPPDPQDSQVGVQWNNQGQPELYRPPTNADYDQAKDAAYNLTGIPDIQQAYHAAQRGEYLPALGQGAFGVANAASLAAPIAGGAMKLAGLETRDVLPTLQALLGDEAGTLRLPSRNRLPALAPDEPMPANLGVPPGIGHNMPPEVQFPQYAEAYPDVGSPATKIDPKSGEEYLGKQLTPAAREFQKARARVAADMAQNGFQPYFDPEQRFPVDPTNYPPNTDTTQIVPGPRAKTTAEEHMAVIGSDEARARLQAAYDFGSNMPNTTNWYALGQLEQAFIKELGPQGGRKAFQDKIATSMAATTGGADPTSNWLMAMYGNYLRNQGLPYPEHTYEMPFPIGGRYAGGNMAMHQKIFDQGGYSALGAANPKRHEFWQAFLGNPNAGTMDEQMTSGMTPGKQVPPAGTYGLYQRVLNEEAAKVPVPPQNFQDVAWAGFKGQKDPTYTEGKPMIQVINESIERTHRLTGMPKDEIVRRGIIRSQIPLYGVLGTVGWLAGLGGYGADQ